MSAITQGELKVKAAIPITDISKLHIVQKKNQHASLYLEGNIPEEAGEEALLHVVGYSVIEIWAGEELLFRGILQSVHIKREGNSYGVVVEGVSFSQILDCEKKNRTFQKTDSTYAEIMKEILGDRDDVGIFFQVSDRSIEKPLYQIEETDWEFILRLAGRVSTAVIPSILSSETGIYVGLPEGRYRDWEEADILRNKIWFDKEKNCMVREIMFYENGNIGDCLNWQGIEYTILSKCCQLRQGLLGFTYEISKPSAFNEKSYRNTNHTGRLLPAEVLDTRDEQIKVKFDMDHSQRVEDAYWYPWRPDVGNLMYCMPQKGEKVYIRLDDSDGVSARAVCGLHGNGEGNPEMKGENRYFTTADMKRMYLLPDVIGFRDLKQKEALEMEVHDSTGAAFRSNKKLAISAKDTIGLKGNVISLQAPQEVSLVRRNPTDPTVINMCNGFDSIGVTNEVIMAGAGEPGFPIFHESEKNISEEYSLEGLEQSIIATTPAVRLENGIEKQIGAGMVDCIMMQNESGTSVKE